MSKHTPGPWHVGAQNDLLYITAGEKPALDNDYPRHDANRTVVAKVYSERDAQLLAAAPDLYEAAQLAEAVLARGKWLESSNDPEAVALRALRAAIARCR